MKTGYSSIEGQTFFFFFNLFKASLCIGAVSLHIIFEICSLFLSKFSQVQWMVFQKTRLLGQG